jgi:ribosomal protein L11 methylase PrmA
LIFILIGTNLKIAYIFTTTKELVFAKVKPEAVVHTSGILRNYSDKVARITIYLS